MKNLFFILCSVLLFISCNNSAEKEETVAEPDSTELPMTRLVWQAGLNDSTGRLEMKQVAAGDSGPLTISSVIDYVNRYNPGINLTYVRTSNDTVYVQIKDATYLTQRMGSSGSVSYLAAVVYNLTDLPGVRYVNFDFEEGDHASPGTFDRTTFNDQ